MPRPLLIIARECLQRLTGVLPEGEVSIQSVLDQCHASLGIVVRQKNIMEDLRHLAMMMEVPFEVNQTEHRKRPKVRVICETCGKECTSGAAFASHMRTHIKEADAEFQSKIQDFGLTSEQIVQSVLIHSIVEPVVRKVEKELKSNKSKGEDGRKLNHKGGVKHRKTYTLVYKARCIDLYEQAAQLEMTCPQLKVARDEEIDVSMLGRWINSKDKIRESLAAQGNKKILSQEKIEKKSSKKKKKRKASLDLSTTHTPGQTTQQILQQLPQHHHQHHPSLHQQHQIQHLQYEPQQNQSIHQQQQQHLQQQLHQHHIQQQQGPSHNGQPQQQHLEPLHMMLLPEMPV